MSIYRGTGGAGDATNDATVTEVTQQALNAQNSANAAATSATAAANSATSASTSASNAASSASTATTQASNAATSATQAAVSASSAATSESNASASATSAATSETNAALSAVSASTDAASAGVSATNASTSASSATASATSAATSASNASTSEANASTSASNASTSASNASTSEANASTSASNAATSESNAATSASNAASSAVAANTSASSASTSAVAANTSEANAATSETNAATSEANAATSEANAATSSSTASTQAANAVVSASQASTSATDASISEAAAEAALESMQGVYLGVQTSDPTLDLNGDALNGGEWYFNSTSNITRIYDGTLWQNGAVSTTSFVQKTGDTMTGTLTAPDFIGPLNGAIQFTAKNTSGGTITKGQAIAISGISGNTPTVTLADADATAMPAFGLAATTATDNNTLEIITFGSLKGVQTDYTGWALGDTLYISTTAGTLTNSAPSGEAAKIQNIGTVERLHSSNGTIKVGGAGRSNATPNLNDGNIFIGNAQGQSVTANFAAKVNEVVDALPSQTGNSGKILTTDGSVASWTDNDPTEVTMHSFEYTATAGQTVFSGVDLDGQTLANVTASNRVYLDGIQLSTSDYSYTASSVTLNSGASVGQELVVVVFDSFTVADHYTKAEVDELMPEYTYKVYEYTATAGQTTFSGSDANGQTLAYTAGLVEVTYGGFDLPTADYTATNGTSIVLDDGAEAGKIVRVIAFESFVVADTYTKAEVDAKDANTGVQGQAFWENPTNITADYTITSGKNAGSFGPITVDTGVTVSVPVGSTWSIV